MFVDQKAFKGSTVISSDGTYFLGVQFDSNLVLYKREENGTVAVWHTNTVKVPDVAFLRLDEDGNLCLYKTDGISKVWESQTSGSGATRLTVENSGDLSLYDSNGKEVWNAGRYEGLCHVLDPFFNRSTKITIIT